MTAAGRAVVGRLAPSPTGVLHVGNARSLLWAWLSARSQGGQVLLRVEDLVPAPAAAVAQVLADLDYLGLDWDDPGAVAGCVVAEDFELSLAARPAFVLQSERAGLHAALLDRLVARGDAYPCICSRKDIELAARAPHAEDKALRYPGTCRGRFADLAAALRFDAARAARAGRTPLGVALRMKAPPGPLRWHDALLGPQAIDVQADSGDFVIRRRDGTAAYMLAVVADDRAMGVSEVLRGDDLAEVTGQQLVVHTALAALEAADGAVAKPTPASDTPTAAASMTDAPRFLHVPLVYGDDGRRLAKRNASLHVQTLRHAGVDPSLLRAFLAASIGLPADGSLPAMVDAYRARRDAGPTLDARALRFDAPELAALVAGALPPLRWHTRAPGPTLS